MHTVDVELDGRVAGDAGLKADTRVCLTVKLDQLNVL